MKIKRKLLLGTLVITSSVVLVGCSPTFNQEVKNNDIMGKMASDVFMTQEQHAERREREERERQELLKQKEEKENKKKKKNKNKSKSEEEYKWGDDRHQDN